MPRYCAVKVCSNRGGTASRHDNKRISFYPFPLQDKSRLQEWVDNMKREEWTPSRHQYLCSEHFTEDCFDIRWGIRYLKNTAVPTMFPSTEEDGENKVTSSERSPNAKTWTLDNDFEPTRLDSPPLSKRPLILRRTCKKVQSSTRNNTVVENTGTLFEKPPLSDTDISCHLNLSEVQTSACEIVKPPPVSFLPPSPHIEPHSEEHTADSTVTVLCCESLGPLSNGEANMDALRTALGQAFSLVPMEMVNGCYWEAGGPSEGEHISACEHSYCRADTDKEQLWSKILSLHAKLLELDQREQSTVAKIHELETEMALLKRDGAAFKERQKVLEDCISSVLI